VTGVDVDPAVLDDYARRWDDRSAAFDSTAAAVRDAEVPRDAFGWIPGIGGRVHDAYQGLLDDLLTGLRSAGGHLAEIGDGLRAAATSYAASDAAGAADAAGLDDVLPSGSGPR
jgi:hypothetical protein